MDSNMNSCTLVMPTIFSHSLDSAFGSSASFDRRVELKGIHQPKNISGSAAEIFDEDNFSGSSSFEKGDEECYLAGILMKIRCDASGPLFELNLNSNTGNYKVSSRKPRIQRSVSPNLDDGRRSPQSFSCAEHYAKHSRCPPNCPKRRYNVQRGDLKNSTSSCDDDKWNSATETYYGSELSDGEDLIVDEHEDEVLNKRLRGSSDTIKVRSGAQPSSLNRKKKSATEFDADSFLISRPVSKKDYIDLLTLGLAQLPLQQGTAEDILSVIYENGWKELRSGEEDFSFFRDSFLAHLEHNFLKISGPNNTFVYHLNNWSASFEMGDVKSRPLRSSGSMERKKKEEDDFGSFPPSVEGSRAPSPVLSSPKESSGKNKSEGKKKGRRWMRFACEKHRREHTKCSENCPMRKITYTLSQEEKANLDIEGEEL